MKKNVSIAILCLIISFFSNHIYADDEKLNLNTNSLKDKQNDYSSLTDINNLNLFSDDMKIILENQEQEQIKQYSYVEKILFSKQLVNNIDEEEYDLFLEPVTIDKTIVVEETYNSIVFIVIILTILLGGIVFVKTRNKYKDKEDSLDENNINIY